MRWDEFAEACPEIAEIAESRFREDQLCMIGTLRSDGSPRISPCEVDLAAGHLLLGMMWRSRKARDLLRDPRCVVHTVQADREAGRGDAKLYGRALAVEDADLRGAFREAIRARIGWAPDEPGYHLFSIDVSDAGFVEFTGSRRALAWDPERGLRRLPPPG